MEGVDLGIDGLGPATALARGGFAQVYRAEQLSFGRPVAIKVLLAPPADAMALTRFERECLAIGAVSGHPSIVNVHDRGETTDGRPYIIMEYRSGGSLADRLAAEGPLNPDDVIGIGIEIADALTVAHRAGVIHRDVKPANILLSAEGEPALADFGIARIDGGPKTMTGAISASVAHAAREVLAGEEPSPQSDVYSLASTLLELVTGRAPYYRSGEATVWALINRVMTDPPPDPTALGVPQPLASVLAQGLSPDLSVRYRTAAELRADLIAARAAADDDATIDFTPQALIPGQRTTQVGASPTMVDGPPPKHRRRRRLLAALATIFGVTALAAAGVVAFVSLSGDDSQPKLELAQATIEPLRPDRTYALTVTNAVGATAYQLVVDDEPIGEASSTVPVYRPEPGRHAVALDVTTTDGETRRTDPVEVYVTPGPPLGGYRVNLAAVAARPENWPTALDEFDRLVEEGHTELVLSLGDTGEHWQFYIDGFGADRAGAWEYCQSFELDQPKCFAAEVPTDDG